MGTLCQPVSVVPREVWPEGDVFGAVDAGPPEETQLLREILAAPLPSESPSVTLGRVENFGLGHCRPSAHPTTGHAPTEPEEPEEEEEEDEEEEEQTVQVSEKEFNFLDYLKR